MNTTNLVSKIIDKSKIKNIIPDKIILSLQYKKHFGEWIDFKKPLTFNEKIYWLKLFNRIPHLTKLADKYEVKKIMSHVLGDKYIVPTYGIWNTFEEINFDVLPNEFVLKCTHDSGSVVICHDKSTFDFNKAKKILKNSLNKNQYLAGREWVYKNIAPRIIAEKLLKNNQDISAINDYKFMVFNGRTEMSFVCTNRFQDLKQTFFDREWKKLPIQMLYNQSELPISKPHNYDLMLEISDKIGKYVNIPFLRVDLYEVNNKIFFSEITFYHDGGNATISPEEWRYKLGKMILLPTDNSNEDR